MYSEINFLFSQKWKNFRVPNWLLINVKRMRSSLSKKTRPWKDLRNFYWKVKYFSLISVKFFFPKDPSLQILLEKLFSWKMKITEKIIQQKFSLWNFFSQFCRGSLQEFCLSFYLLTLIKKFVNDLLEKAFIFFSILEIHFS